VKNGIYLSPNEAEFRAYLIIFQIQNDMELNEALVQIPSDLLKAPEILMALEVSKCIVNKDFVGFFRILNKAPYLFACSMIFNMTHVRKFALQQMRLVRSAI
jgi:hypothetical protein